jgi:preprotein translocase subunit SecE
MANPVKTFVSYLRESKQELEKVTWPSRKDTIRYSIITVILTTLMGLYFGVLDFGLNEGFNALLKAYS